MKPKASKSKKTDTEHSKRGRGRPPMNAADKLTALPLTLRLPPALLERIDALTETFEGACKRATVLRLALDEGVRVLELQRNRKRKD